MPRSSNFQWYYKLKFFPQKFQIFSNKFFSSGFTFFTIPEGMWRQYDVNMMSYWRQPGVVSSSLPRNNVTSTLLRHHVSARIWLWLQTNFSTDTNSRMSIQRRVWTLSAVWVHKQTSSTVVSVCSAASTLVFIFYWFYTWKRNMK